MRKARLASLKLSQRNYDVTELAVRLLQAYFAGYQLGN